MKGTVWQRLDFVARMMIPMLDSLCLVVVTVLPLRLPEASFVVPALALMAVYYWGLHRADLLPVSAIFFIGFLQDILSGGPLGIHTLSFLVVYGICVSQRRFFYGKSFMVVWWGFMVIAGGALILEWALTSVFLERLVSPRSIYFKYMMTIALYPVVTWFFVRMQRALPVAE